MAGRNHALQSEKYLFLLILLIINMISLFFLMQQGMNFMQIVIYGSICHGSWFIIFQRREWNSFWKSFWTPLRYQFKALTWIAIAASAYFYPFFSLLVVAFFNLRSLDYLSSMTKKSQPIMEQINVQDLTEKYKLNRIQERVDIPQNDSLPKQNVQAQQNDPIRRKVRIQQPHDAVSS